jgi:hypothetical protein
MRVRVSSYILACLFILFGLWCLVTMPRFLQMFSELKLELPLLTRAILAPTGIVWCLVSLLFAVVVI